jgi:hypothetical protein
MYPRDFVVGIAVGYLGRAFGNEEEGTSGAMRSLTSLLSGSGGDGKAAALGPL